MPIFSRFAKYLKPYIGSTLLAVVCALAIAICEMGYIYILADTIDALKLIETRGFEDGSIDVRYFQVEGFFDGVEVSLSGASVALQLVGWVLAGILTLVLIKGIFTYFNDYLMARVGHQLILRVRNELYGKLIFARLGVLREHRTGDLMSRVTDDVRTWQNAVGSTANIIRAVVFIPVFVSMMLVRSFKLTVLALLVFPLLAYLIARFATRIRNTSAEIQQHSADIASQLKETIFGIKIIKSFTAENAERKRFATTNRKQ